MALWKSQKYGSKNILQKKQKTKNNVKSKLVSFVVIL